MHCLGFCNHNTIDIWGQVILSFGGCPVHYKVQCSAAALASPHQMSVAVSPIPPPVVMTKMSPDIAKINLD
jgi:hypothetical protein